MPLPGRASRVSCIVVLLALVAAAPAAAGRAAQQGVPAAAELRWWRVQVRTEPSFRAERMTALRQLRADYRRQVVLVVARARDARGRLWYRISLARRPNGTTGWVPAPSLELRPITRRVVIDISARTLRVISARRVLFATRVAVGKPGAETPAGRFYVTARVRPTIPFYGPFAFETSAFSRLTDWPGGGRIGIHGTNVPQLIGTAASHGCVRVTNTAVLRLERLLPLGTPVVIVP